MDIEMLAAAIQAEVKWTEDHFEGNRHYRKGYIKALNVVGEFLSPSSQALQTDYCPASLRLLSFALACSVRSQERQSTQTAAATDRVSQDMAT